ncbi:MAG: ABC transporter permease [Bacilli bacterium]|nr:ABC transporter permease [Bacilli bacterium]
MNVIMGAVTQGFLWSIMAIGVYISYRILDISDLTSEGSFTLGAATMAALIAGGCNPFLATFIAAIAGAVAGLVTGFLHTKLRIPTLLAGILVMTGVYSVNLRIMGKANISLNQSETMLTILKDKVTGLFPALTDIMSRERDVAIIVGVIGAILVIFFVWWLMNTEFGYAIRATGNNEKMIRASGVNTNTTKVIGLMLGNGLVALSGALVGQYNGYADVGMGIGAIVIGLASVIIGEVFFGRKHLLLSLVGIVVGSIIYRLIVAIVLQAGLPANDMKLFTAILVAIALALPMIKDSILAKKGE